MLFLKCSQKFYSAPPYFKLVASTFIIIHQTHYEKSDWSRAFNQFTIACELDMINVLSAADIALCSSRKYPYPHHGGNFTQAPPPPRNFHFLDTKITPPPLRNFLKFYVHPPHTLWTKCVKVKVNTHTRSLAILHATAVYA